MLTILDRYLLREVIQTWVAVTFVLLVIMLTTRFARYLGEAAAGNLPSEAVFALLGLTSIHYLTVLVPVSLFLAVMLALGRLYRDNEMVAIMSCGVGYGDLWRPLMGLATLVAVGLALLSMVVSPWAGQASHRVQVAAEREVQATGFDAGRFRTSDQGATVFYAESVSDGGREMSNVFIQQRDEDQRIMVSLAERGEQRLDEATGERMLVLYDGRRYLGQPGAHEYQIIEFREHGVRVDLGEPDYSDARRSAQPTALLWRSGEPGDLAELQWRISVPLMGLLLVLLAVPLGRVSPRQGRYGKLLAAILVYVLYSNLLGISQVWIERGQLPGWIGLWWVHLLVVAFTVFLVGRHYGWRYLRQL